MPAVEIDRLLRVSRHAGEVWQGGLVRMPAWVREEDRQPFRPVMALWVDSHCRELHHGDPLDPHKATHEDALTALIELASNVRRAFHRPGSIEVNDPELARYLTEHLAAAEIEVVHRERLRFLAEAMDLLYEEFDAGTPWMASAEDADPPLLRGFADAAAEFYRARPWDLLTDEDRIRIETPAPDAQLQCCVVLGAGGAATGLGFFPSFEFHDAMQNVKDVRATISKLERWALLFGPIDELPFADADLWESERLPVAGAEAYPDLVHTMPGREAPPPMRASVPRFLEGLLLALARSTETDIDSGRWSKSVETSSGPTTIELALPDLLHPVEAALAAGGGARMNPRVTERVLGDLQRLLEGKAFESEADVNAFLNANFDGSIEPLPACTPREQAQDLVHAAYGERGHRRRMQFARRALEIDPDCADAYVLLAAEAGTPERALPLWEQAESVARRALDPAMFQDLAVSFRGVLETRPFTRAKAGRAEALRAVGRNAEAVEHYQELLRLNPDDNQGVRDPLAVCLLELDRHDELVALLDRYPDDAFALPLYVRALLAFRTEGETPGAAQLLRQAVRTNRHVPAFLLGKKPLPPLSDSFTPGDKYEAALCVAELAPVWESTPGARDWLAVGARGTPSGDRGAAKKKHRDKHRGKRRRS